MRGRVLLKERLARHYKRTKWHVYRWTRNSQGIVSSSEQGYKIRLHFSDVSAPHIYFGYYEPEETLQVCQLVSSGMIAMDIGANIGYFMLLMANRVGPEGRVYGLEPNPLLFTRLKENVDLNPGLSDGRVVLHQAALGARDEEAEFFCPILGHEGVGGLKNTNRAPLSETIRVPVRTMDGFLAAERIDRLHFIKMDVEGGELDVLRGAQRALEELRPTILFEAFEANTAPYGYRVFEILSYLEQRGFIVKQVGMGQNFLATPKERV